ncbi:MAG: phosphoketolase family protein [Waddliaceae bacterium]
MLKLKGEEKKSGPVSREEIEKIDQYFRATNYLGVAQVYLKDNALLKRGLQSKDIKPRLLGHFGTVPGINFVYTHLNRLILKTDANMMLVVGPGHGAPANLANLFLEGTLQETDPRLDFTEEGINLLARQFSWPGGAPSHLVPDTPGTIQEGGELGYCLLHSYGAVLDNPDLIVACLIGDGEAETGALATSWWCNRFINPRTSGTVLPIIHLNGYKIGGPTMLGRMDDESLNHLFFGFGYQVCIISGNDPIEMHQDCIEALDWAYAEIQKIKNHYDPSSHHVPRFPMIILRTPKGWTCPIEIDGKPVENTFRAHQIPIPNPKDNPAHLKRLEEWMHSYHPEELFEEDGAPKKHILAMCPKGDKRMGRNVHCNGGSLLQPLKLPEFEKYALSIDERGVTKGKATTILGNFLRDVVKENPHNFLFFCPDEITSNRLQAIFEVTERAWMAEILQKDEFLSPDGRVIEMLSEHVCQGLLEGYLVTGRHGLFACYEAFIPVVDSMLNQFAKWLKVSKETPWRKPIASLNYLLTSHVWRQDHNGYSHQVPSFVNNLVNKKGSVARIYFPPDANCLLSVTDHCLRSRDYVNLIIADKQEFIQWLSIDEAKIHCAKGASIWHWAGNEEGEPDVILCAAGDVPTTETVAAAWYLQKHLPGLKVRVVNVVDLFVMISPDDHPHGMGHDEFLNIFTNDIHVVFAFHGYPGLIHEIIHHRPNTQRFHVHGYQEEGTTTTPFDMLMLNESSRYQLAIAALDRVSEIKFPEIPGVRDIFLKKLKESKDYIFENGEDIPEVKSWSL